MAGHPGDPTSIVGHFKRAVLDITENDDQFITSYANDCTVSLSVAQYDLSKATTTGEL